MARGPRSRCCVAAILLASAAACSAPSTPEWSIVALGDSVPAGTNCDCTPYPQLTALDLTNGTREVTAMNDAVGGLTTDRMLRQLQSDHRVRRHVRSAHLVEVEVGANDLANTRRCGTELSCYSPEVPPMQSRLEAIVAQIHRLTAIHNVPVILLDYWSVWQGGQYAQKQGETYVVAATQITDWVNTAIRSTAQDTGSALVDLRAAFKGPNYAYDETHYLSNDGDHPNAAGHRQIADATGAVIQPRLTG